MKDKTTFNWLNNFESLAKLAEMLREGKSSRQIADHFNKTYGAAMTRNAIIGAAHRHLAPTLMAMRPARDRLSHRPAQARPRVIVAQAVVKEETTPMVQEAEVVEVDFTEHPVMRLQPHHCRWPYNTPGQPNFSFCCAPRAYPRPYCADHCRIAYGRNR